MILFNKKVTKITTVSVYIQCVLPKPSGCVPHKTLAKFTVTVLNSEIFTWHIH